VRSKAPTRDKQAFLRRLNEIAAEALSQGIPVKEISSGLRLVAKGVETE
jgi:hypothetical protein